MEGSLTTFSPSAISISQCVTLKLTETNYLLWKTQFESFLSSQMLLGYVTGATPRPSPTSPIRNGDTVTEAPNPEFLKWVRNDQNVLTLLFGSLSEEALRSVYGLHTSQEVWFTLAKKFNRVSATRKLDLQRRLNNLSKQGKTMTQYLSDAKVICDQLDSIGRPLTDQEKIYGVLHGLGQEYETISTFLENSMDQFPGPNFEDAGYRLINFDDKLQGYNSAAAAVTPHLAFAVDSNSYNQGKGQGYGRSGSRGRGRGYSTQGRGFHQQINTQSPGSGSERPTCQICGKYGHSAFKCYKRFDHSYQLDDFHQAMAAMKVSDQPSGHEWVPDSAATAHITNSTTQLQNSQPYKGDDGVIVGNGDFLPITHIGSIALPTMQGTTLPLKDVLVCPDITKSLLSVSKLTADYPCSFTFDSDGVIVKDKQTKQLLTRGSRTRDLYVLDNPQFTAFYSSRQQVATDGIWHQRLGHPHNEILHQLSTSNAIVMNKTSSHMCDACQLGKTCKLPFSASDFVSSRPLERIHCDLWGPSPVVSSQGFRYYVIFIDNFSRFTWFYPLKLKSDFFSIFILFQQLVENLFMSKIANFQCDGGGEFTSATFVSHLGNCGIKQLISCPYTPQQNGLAERKHRHITELGLAMMFQSRVPQYLWVEAFFTASFLGNLLPSSVLPNNKSPYELLMGKPPIYTSLRVFGSACYPYLRPYTKNKFDPRSLLCVFLGYNEKYKGYRCLYPPTGKVYICRHVLFDELHFPFQNEYASFIPIASSPLLSAWQQTFMQATQDRGDNSQAPLQQSEIQLTAPVITVMQGCTERTIAFDAASIGDSVSVPTCSSPPQNNSPPSPRTPIVVTPSSTTSPATSPTDSIFLEDDFPPLQSPNTASTHNNDHPMITRAKDGIKKPNPRYALLTVKSNYPEPKTVKTALKDPGWNGAMSEEVGTMHETETWDLVPPEEEIHPLGCKWVFKTKLCADGSLDKLKARLVAKGYEQEEGVDFVETYSPVVRTATIRTILHEATINKWDIKQLDVKNAFLHGDLKETVYMVQPPGFEDPSKPDYICKLKKAIYGLKQAPRAWFDKFSSFLLEFGFVCSYPDPSLFVYLKGTDVMFLLLYVDDMLLTGNNKALMDQLLVSLSSIF